MYKTVFNNLCFITQNNSWFQKYLNKSKIKNNSMRFKKYLDKNIYEPYSGKYLSFDVLLAMIRNNFTKEEENDFKEAFDTDLNKVFSFIQFKHEEFESRMYSIEEEIKNKKIFKVLSEAQDEMAAFAEFIRINIEGFKTILLKHDKKTGYTLVPEYRKVFKKKLNSIAGLNKLIYSASRLKLKTIEVKTKKESGVAFVRKTSKYWVHPENLYALKLKIVKNLPVYVYDPDPKPDDSPYKAWDYKLHDTCVSSVYLDNSKFEVYMERLYKNQGAEAIRIRWYGSTIPKIVFVERKRHEDNWTGLQSKKLRFKIPEKYVVDYLNGVNVWEHVKLLNGSEVFDLYKEIQSAIIKQKLKPSVRTFYNRNAFQLPNDSTVRISLDTNLVMIRERNPNTKDDDLIKEWRRPDAVCEWPFKNLPSEDIVRFPYGILEIKTQGMDESKPDWIEDIIKGSYVENVHKYSKFMHGSALLYKNIEVIPYWLPQMKTDIRKDPFHPIKEVKIIENNLLLTQSEIKENSSENLSLIENHGKKIAMPTRTEPKVFMANERTFLKWIQFAIFLGGIGTAILGLGDSSAALCGSALMIVSLLFVFYAFYIYNWRIKKIRIRFPGPYDDLIGPTILVLVFLLALILSIAFRYPNILGSQDID